jgi:2-(3-amino-3-carboxypropyl)histidine synthase
LRRDKVLFIECRWKGELSKDLVEKIRREIKNYEKIGIFTTVQFIEKLGRLKKEIERLGKKVLIGKGKLTKYPGQVLGCDLRAIEEIKSKVDCLLYLGSGKFHPLGVKIAKPIIIADPLTNEVSKISKEEIKRLERRRRIAIAKVREAKKLGMLVSTKPGQYGLRKAIELKQKLEKKGKEVFIFIFDTLAPNELLNFPGIEVWINTACPRLSEEEFGGLIINLGDLIEN